MSFVVGKKKVLRSVKIDPDVLSWSFLKDIPNWLLLSSRRKNMRLQFINYKIIICIRKSRQFVHSCEGEEWLLGRRQDSADKRFIRVGERAAVSLCPHTRDVILVSELA